MRTTMSALIARHRRKEYSQKHLPWFTMVQGIIAPIISQGAVTVSVRRTE